MEGGFWGGGGSLSESGKVLRERAPLCIGSKVPREWIQCFDDGNDHTMM